MTAGPRRTRYGGRSRPAARPCPGRGGPPGGRRRGHCGSRPHPPSPSPAAPMWDVARCATARPPRRRLGTAVQQARNDRKAILKIMERVPKSEKKLLPDVIVTVDGLLKRAEDLARTAHAMSGDVDRAALSRLEDKIEVTKREPDSPERERQLNLLQRQRQTLTDLLTRRQLVEDQIESCVLAMQNVRFDLLRLRSAGVAAVLDDLTHATQQARAPSRAVDHAIAAAGEIKALLGAAGAWSASPRRHRAMTRGPASRPVPRPS